MCVYRLSFPPTQVKERLGMIEAILSSHLPVPLKLTFLYMSLKGGSLDSYIIIYIQPCIADCWTLEQR
jgi:hypothetical protein